MTNNVKIIKNQIKAFNKMYQRAEKAGIVSDQFGAIIDDLIDYDRMTQKGYAKAGNKFLESLTPEELASYSADIEAAVSNLKVNKFSLHILDELGELEDPKSALWKMYDKLQDMGHPFDSSQVKELADNIDKVDYRETIRNMAHVAYADNFGQADFYEWFSSQEVLF